MTISGTPKFSALSIREMAVEFTAGGDALSCKAAFIDPTTHQTYGWTKGEGAAVWSRETVEMLHALRNSMEADLAAIHFYGSVSTASPIARPIPEPGGLKEHLDEADQA